MAATERAPTSFGSNLHVPDVPDQSGDANEAVSTTFKIPQDMRRMLDSRSTDACALNDNLRSRNFTELLNELYNR